MRQRSHIRLGPRRARSVAEGSFRRTTKDLQSWMGGTVRGCVDLDPEAVLRVSFLRGLRVLRVKLRRRDA